MIKITKENWKKIFRKYFGDITDDMDWDRDQVGEVEEFIECFVNRIPYKYKKKKAQ